MGSSSSQAHPLDAVGAQLQLRELAEAGEAADVCHLVGCHVELLQLQRAQLLQGGDAADLQGRRDLV